MPSCLAIFAHPDDVEYFAAGTMLQLAKRGWDLHYFDLCAGNGGSVQMDGPTTATVRLAEAQQAARILGAKFYPPVVNDMTLTFDIEVMRKVASVIRQTRADIVLTHALSDYMEDHMACARLATSAAFTHGMPNFDTVPPAPTYAHDVTIYHAMPHGLRTPLRQKVRAGLYVDVAAVHDQARQALAAHASQKDWLDKSQGMDSYLLTLDKMATAVGELSGKYQLAQGWCRHHHLGYSASEIDPLRSALGSDCVVDATYEAALDKPFPERLHAQVDVRLIKEQQSPASANELVACEHLSQRDFGCVWHHHPEIEIFFLLRGGTERWVGDKITPLKVGEVLLLGSDLPHDFRNDRKGRQAGVEWILVQFRPNLFGEDWTQHSSVAAIRRLLERARLGLEFRGATRRQAAVILHKMPKAHGLRRLALLIELLELAAGSDELKEIASTGFHATTDAQTSDRIGNVVAHIKANLSKPLYVPELAGLAGLSESAFSRLFKKCTGRSVPQYLNELRIARAARLLAETDESVKQIAHQCGYPTAAYFHRQFQRHQALPPLAYREAIRRHS